MNMTRLDKDEPPGRISRFNDKITLIINYNSRNTSANIYRVAHKTSATFVLSKMTVNKKLVKNKKNSETMYNSSS